MKPLRRLPTHAPTCAPTRAPTRVPTRAFRSAVAPLLATLLLAACAGPPLPPPQWWRLPVEATPPVAAAPAASVVAAAPVWQLVGGLPLPGHLDRDALLVPGATGALQPLGAARWAEPLRDALPRLLRHDLQRLLGAPLWTAPLPPGVLPTRQLRVELLAFDLQRDAAAVRGLTVQARYSVTGPALAPRGGEIAFSQRVAGADAASLVQAHRDAVAALAQKLAAELR
jgi:hypothetical protein